MTQISSQPGQMTANDVSTQAYPVFPPVMYMPQMQDESFMYQNQQVVPNTMTFPGVASTNVTNTNSTSLLNQVPNQTAGAAPTISSEKSTAEGEGEEPKLQENAAAASFQMQYSQVQPAQFVQPFMFPQVPLMQQQVPQYVPCVVPGAPFQPTFQPMVFVPQQTATTTLKQPELHPTMRSDSSHSRHESYDGSEYSDVKSNSLRRFSSDHSKDGYGSDYWDNRSRLGSEHHEDDEQKEEDKTVYDGSRTSSRQNYNASNARYHSKGRENHYRGRERSRSDSQKRPTSRERQEEMYKTELCSAWVNSKKCRFGHRCIFAHGLHELRSAKRKQARQRMRPVLKKYIRSLLNKITEKNFDEIITEYLTICVEEIGEHNISTDGRSALESLVHKAIAEKDTRVKYINVFRKLFRLHPKSNRLKEYTSAICFSEYNNPRNKTVAVGTIHFIGLLVESELIDDAIVHRILDQMKGEKPKELHVELWCKLIGLMRGRVDADLYMQELRKFKTMSSRIRFMIMDLEELQKNNWN